jgi:hypothetical protein
VAIIRKAKRRMWSRARRRAVIGVPAGATTLECRALLEAGHEAGLRKVALIPEPVAGAVGSGDDPLERRAHMVVDVGGGTSEITAFCYGGILSSRTCRVAGDELTRALSQYLRAQHQVIVGELTAEKIKVAMDDVADPPLIVEGRDAATGRARLVTVETAEVKEALQSTTTEIMQTLTSCLEELPGQAVSDILGEGIVAIGGGALLSGFTQSLEEIANRLDDRFRLLTRGSRTALPRHRTLHAVVEWSWDLLGEPERRLARRLPVFAGGCDLAAVAAVCGSPEPQVLDLLDDLTEKSLVEAVGGRYRMLETIRAFCAERLAEAGEEESLRRAHTAHFLAVAENAEPHLRGWEQLEWLRVLDTDRDNVNVALHQAIDDGEVSTALRLFAALSFYWWMRGMRREATGFAGRILSRLPDEAPDGLRAEHLMCALTVALSGTDRARLEQLRDATAEYYRAVANGTESLHRPFLLYLSAVAMGPEMSRESLLIHRHHDFAAVFADGPWLAAMWRLGTAYVPLLDGELEEARSGFGEACHRFRALGDRWGLMVALNGLTDTAQRGGDVAGALASVEEALTLAEELGSLIDSADLLHMQGQVLRRSGDTAGGEAALNRAIDTSQRAGAPEYSAAARVTLATMALERGQVDTARRLAEQARAECPVGWYLAEHIRGDIARLLADIAQRDSD